MNEFEDLFKTMADREKRIQHLPPLKRETLLRLKSWRTIQSLVKEMGLKYDTMYRHLKVAHDQGFIEIRYSRYPHRTIYARLK